MKKSKLQQTIIKAVKENNENLIIQAAAGSGKTTTLKFICQALPEQEIYALAFNKAIANEFDKKLPSNAEGTTLHSLGFKMILSNFNIRKIYVDKNKIIKKSKNYFANKPIEKNIWQTWISGINHLASLAFNLNIDYHNIDELKKVAIHYGIDIDDKAIIYVSEIMDISLKDTRNISFDDMIYMPVYYGININKKYKRDIILVDEAQDLNPIQMELIKLLKSRVVFVGDRNQAIYAFRGADSKAMDTIKKQFSCKELPLSVCYRCDENIISEAQKIVGSKEIQASEFAQNGEIINNEDNEQWKEKLEDEMVLCRTNAPLVKLCFELLKKGKKANIRGRDIGEGLIQAIEVIEKKGNKNLNDILNNMVEHNNELRLRYEHAEKWNAIEALNDKEECIHIFAETCSTIDELKNKINNIFSDFNNPGVLLSSIHKAKGLEAPVVMLLCPELLPHPMAKTDEAKQQENNLKYVAITRAMNKLIYQPWQNGWKK